MSDDEVQGEIDRWYFQKRAFGMDHIAVMLQLYNDGIDLGWPKDERLAAAKRLQQYSTAVIDQADMLHALWTIAYHGGYEVHLAIVGKELFHRVEAGDYRFQGEWSEIGPQLKAWADAIQKRDVGAAIPAPPQITDHSPWPPVDGKAP